MNSTCRFVGELQDVHHFAERTFRLLLHYTRTAGKTIMTDSQHAATPKRNIVAADKTIRTPQRGHGDLKS